MGECWEASRLGLCWRGWLMAGGILRRVLGLCSTSLSSWADPANQL